MSAIAGDMVSLSIADGEGDREILIDWIASGGSVLSSAGSRMCSRSAARKLLDEGAGTLVMATGNDGGAPIGGLRWSQAGYAGAFILETFVGDDGAWQQGAGLEAVRLAIGYLFHSCNAHRVELTFGVYNLPMAELLQDEYIVMEALLRDYYFVDGEYHAAVVCSALRADYYAACRRTEVSAVSVADDAARARELLRVHLAKHPQDPRAVLTELV